MFSKPVCERKWWNKKWSSIGVCEAGGISNALEPDVGSDEVAGRVSRQEESQ